MKQPKDPNLKQYITSPFFECNLCGLKFPHDAAMREHMRTSGCGVKASPPRKITSPIDFRPLDYQRELMRYTERVMSVDPRRSSELQEMANYFTNQMEDMRRQFGSMIDDLGRELSRMRQQVAGLEKQIQTINTQPTIHKERKPATDYTKVFSEDEDGLEENYRGWPSNMEKIF